MNEDIRKMLHNKLVREMNRQPVKKNGGFYMKKKTQQYEYDQRDESVRTYRSRMSY